MTVAPETLPRPSRRSSAFRTEQIGFAAETLILSLLIRRGFDAAMTMGTTKAVDIVAVASDGRAMTIDAKGAYSNRDFAVGTAINERAGHFYVLVYFSAKFDDPRHVPEVYVVPGARMREVMTTRTTGTLNVSGRMLRASPFEHAWDLLGPP